MKLNLEQLIEYHFPWAPSDSVQRLQTYLSVLEDWNNRVNLTGIPTDQWLDKIVSESAVLITLVPGFGSGFKRDYWMDMGTGGGIPGLIIAAMCPDQPLVLVDSRRKKIDFVRHAVSEMGLASVEIVNDRLEQVVLSDPRIKRSISVFFSRALADLEKLINYADPFAAEGSVLISPRGGKESENRVDFRSKDGRGWSGRIHSVPVPGFERDLKFAKCFLEASCDAKRVSKM